MNDTLALVGALSSYSRDDLRRVLDARRFSATGVRDWFDLADALLALDSVDAAMHQLPRPVLDQLVAHELTAESEVLLRERGLAVGLEPLESVIQRAQDLHTASSAHPAPDEAATGALSEHTEQASREQALVLTARLDELIDLIEATGLRSVSRGGVSAGDTTRVLTTLGELPAPLDVLVGLLDQAQLIELNANFWRVTDLTQWRDSASAEKWMWLARAWRENLHPALHDAFAQRAEWAQSLTTYLEWLYPISTSWLSDQLTPARVQAELLALSVGGVRAPLGELMLAGADDHAVELMRRLVPEYIESVLLQSDLTIIAPGPLRPDLEAELRKFATVESRSVASTYRLSSTLMSRAMDEGVTASHIEEFLSRLSSTGIPQPVAYLIADLGKKHASIRVRAHASGAVISCNNAQTAAQLLADSGLKVLNLSKHSENTLSTPFDVSVVMRNLRTEKYPAAVENETGEIQRWNEKPLAASVSGTRPTTHPHHELIERLLQTPVDASGSDEKWMNRQIELAIRNKIPLAVTVSLPDGTQREFTIDPRALNNGRLRGLDKRSEVERTIPMSSIVALHSLS